MDAHRSHRYRFRLGSRPSLPLRPAQLLLRQLMLLSATIVPLYNMLAGDAKANSETIRPAIRSFIAWNFSVSISVHTCFAVLHEGGDAWPVILERIQAIALAWPVGFVLFLWLSAMFGISFMKESLQSAHWAALLSTLVVSPIAAVAGLNSNRWQYVFVQWSPSGTDELSAAIPAIAAVLGAFLGAFPMPLDWGSDWQVWPVSSVIGALAGYTLGIVTCLPIAMTLRKQT